MDEDEAFPTTKIRLYPCDICNRNFKQESLQKHRLACKKVSKPRKIFDSGKQRAEGSDVVYAKTRETKKIQIEGVKTENEPKQSNWREKHNDFIRSVRNARNITLAEKEGRPIPKFEPSAVPSDYVNCPYCNRNFNRTAAERHIPFCETQSKRQKINNSANQKLKPKVQAPSSGQRKQSSDVYEQSSNAMHNGRGFGGYQSGSMANKGFSSGNERKPIRYDSNNYYDDTQDFGSGVSSGAGGAYSMKNKALLQASKTKQEQMLRTGRNTTNSELNTLARNRGAATQKEPPINSRDASNKRIPQQATAQAQNGNRGAAHGRVTGGAQQQYHQQQQQNGGDAPSPGTKFCHECGSEFPVQWARFCSYCGNHRL